MKTRIGFVSNSSSSSFIICGISINDYKEELSPEEAKKLFKPEILEEFPKRTSFKGEKYFDLFDVLDFGLLYVSDDEGNSYIGEDPDINNINLSIFDIKQKAVNSLNKVLLNPVSIEDVSIEYGTFYEG